MSDMLAAAQAVAAQKPVHDLADIAATDGEIFAGPVCQDFFRRCHGANVADLNAALSALMPALRSADFYHAGIVAILCGTLVEWGGDPAIAVGAIGERLRGQVSLAANVAPRWETDTPEAVFGDAPEAFGAHRTVHLTLRAVMAMICRDMAARQRVRSIAGLADALEELEPYVPEADFLRQTLALTDGMELVVLHPELRRGFRVSLEAVGTNFHLFTLLQDAVIGDPAQGFLPGAPTDKKTMAIARGEEPPIEDAYDSARFQFHNWFGLLPNGTVDGANMASWIWGEGAPADIDPFDGERVVLLGKTVLASRSWSGFFLHIHDALRSDVRVTARLSDAEVTGYLDRMHETVVNLSLR